ncbi:hypothetical protein HDU76_007415 [Blyttiomyces sp. JEL0837]|nr:hypothetical protein HDU76_007415 [Blyttiomyces sp. JEL0837]
MLPFNNSISDGVGSLSVYGNATLARDCFAFASVITGTKSGFCDALFLDYIGPGFGKEGNRNMCITRAGFEVVNCIQNFRGDGVASVYPYPFHFESTGSVTRDILKAVITDDGSTSAPPAAKKNGVNAAGVRKLYYEDLDHIQVPAIAARVPLIDLCLPLTRSAREV